MSDQASALEARDELARTIRRRANTTEGTEQILAAADTYAARASATARTAERAEIRREGWVHRNANLAAGTYQRALEANQARIAELTELAGEILGRYCDAIGTDQPADIAAELWRWKLAITKGQT